MIALLSLCIVMHLAVEQIAGNAGSSAEVMGPVGVERNKTSRGYYSECGQVGESLKLVSWLPIKAKYKQLPYTAHIKVGFRPCGGAILSNRHILTTIECAKKGAEIRYGDWETPNSVEDFRVDTHSGLAMIKTEDEISLDDDGFTNCIESKKLNYDKLILATGISGCEEVGARSFLKYHWHEIMSMSPEEVRKQPNSQPRWIDTNEAIVTEDQYQIAYAGWPLVQQKNSKQHVLVGIAHTRYSRCTGSAYIQVGKHADWIKSALGKGAQ